MKILSNGLTSWYFSKKALPYGCVLMLDCLIVFLSGYVSYYLSEGGNAVASHFWPLTYGLLITTAIFALQFKLFHTYTGFLRYSSLVDLQRSASATLVGALISYGVFLVARGIGLHSIVFLNLLGCVVLFALSTLLMWVERILVKSVYEYVTNNEHATRVFIYGVRDGGVALAKAIQNQKPQRYRLAGFVSPDGDLDTKYLLGVHVRRVGPNLVKHMQEAQATALLVDPTRADDFRGNQMMADELMAHDIKIMVMPQSEVWDAKTSPNLLQLHEIDIEDLLPREVVTVDTDAIANMLAGRCVLITGAAGAIGSELTNQIATYGPSQLVLVDQAETPLHDLHQLACARYPQTDIVMAVGNVTDAVHMEKLFARYHPEVVIHAAIYKYVATMEDNPDVAVHNNVGGTCVVADMAVRYGAQRFVLISTDRAVNPTSITGCTRRINEIYCQSINQAIADGKVSQHDGQPAITRFITVRFGNALGGNNSFILQFRKQIQAGGPITIASADMMRYFILITEACKLVLEASAMGVGGEVFVFDMGQPVRLVELAQHMIKLYNAKDIEIKYTGLTCGEKTYEEVLTNAEQAQPTTNDHIFRVESQAQPYDSIYATVHQLNEKAQVLDDTSIVQLMTQIVPEYRKCAPATQQQKG